MSEQEKNGLEKSVNEAPSTPAKADKIEKAKKNKMPEKKKNPGMMQRLSRFVREIKSELKKVAWPTKNQTFNNTLVVIACVIVVGIFVWIFDWVAGLVINALLSLFGH